MANRSWYPNYSYGLGRVYLEFGFTAGGASAPALSSVFGADCVLSFAHTGGTQIITVNLKDNFNKVCYASADSEGGGASGDWATVDTISNEASATPISFTIKTWQAAGSARNDQTGRVRCCLAFRNTTQQPGAGAV